MKQNALNEAQIIELQQSCYQAGAPFAKVPIDKFGKLEFNAFLTIFSVTLRLCLRFIGDTQET